MTHIEVMITPGTNRFALDDPGWRAQAAALYAMLGEDAVAVSARSTPTAGAKGAIDAAIIALGSSGALTAAVSCFRAWLARDKTRTLTITWTDGAGAERRFDVAGDNIDSASFQALVKDIGDRLKSD